MSDDNFSETRLTDWFTNFQKLCRECRAEAVNYDTNNFDVLIRPAAGGDLTVSVAARAWLISLLVAFRDREKELSLRHPACSQFLGEDETCEQEARWEVTAGNREPDYYCDRHLCDACDTTLSPVTVRQLP